MSGRWDTPEGQSLKTCCCAILKISDTTTEPHRTTTQTSTLIAVKIGKVIPKRRYLPIKIHDVTSHISHNPPPLKSGDPHTKRSPTHSDIYQRLYWHNWFSWWWARGWLKHVENWNKYIEKNCASSWSFTKDHNKIHGQQKMKHILYVGLLD